MLAVIFSTLQLLFWEHTESQSKFIRKGRVGVESNLLLRGGSAVCPPGCSVLSLPIISHPPNAKSLTPSSHLFSQRCRGATERNPCCCRLNQPCFLGLSSHVECSNPWPSWSTKSTLVYLCLSCIGKHKIECSTVEGMLCKGSWLLFSISSSHTAENIVAPFCCQGTVLAPTHSLSANTPYILPAVLVSSDKPSWHNCKELFLPRWRTLHFSCCLSKPLVCAKFQGVYKTHLHGSERNPHPNCRVWVEIFYKEQKPITVFRESEEHLQWAGHVSFN